MGRMGSFLTGKLTLFLAALLGSGAIGQPAAADDEGFFTVRRSIGLVFLGGSALMVKQGFDFKNEADDYYERYKRATDPQEIDHLYGRTNNRDIKSQISWALAAALGASGLRLVLVTPPEKSFEKVAAVGSQVEGVVRRLELVSQIDAGRLGLSLQKRFY